LNRNVLTIKCIDRPISMHMQYFTYIHTYVHTYIHRPQTYITAVILKVWKTRTAFILRYQKYETVAVETAAIWV